MAKTRMISTDFWSDTWIDSLDPIEKLLYIYCFTNDKSCWSWCTEIPIKKIAYETWIDRDMVRKLLNRFQDQGKVIYHEWHLIVKNFIKYHFNWLSSPEKRSKNNQYKSIKSWTVKLKDSVFKVAVEFIPELLQIVHKDADLSEKHKGLARGLQGACKGILPLPSSLPSSSPPPLPINTNVEQAQNDPPPKQEEQSHVSYWREDINWFLEKVKSIFQEEGVTYCWSWTKERQQANAYIRNWTLTSTKQKYCDEKWYKTIYDFIRDSLKIAKWIKFWHPLNKVCDLYLMRENKDKIRLAFWSENTDRLPQTNDERFKWKAKSWREIIDKYWLDVYEIVKTQLRLKESAELFQWMWAEWAKMPWVVDITPHLISNWLING